MEDEINQIYYEVFDDKLDLNDILIIRLKQAILPVRTFVKNKSVS